MIDLLRPLLAVTEEGPVEPSNVGIGSVVLTVAAALFLSWVGYLVINSRRRARRLEETPANLQPYLSDDELENARVTRVLNSAVVAAAVLAIALPVYFINEGNRQNSAADKIHEKNIEEGEKWFSAFSCINCHGPGGGGGAAPFVEARSGLDVAWTAPSINDVFYRYDESEVRYWIVNGRAGTPMPAGGLDAGGAMTEQEIDQVIDYLRSVQIPQSDAVDEVDKIVQDALDRMAGGSANVQRLIVEQEAQLADTQTAPERYAVIEDLPTEIRFLMAGDGTCTRASAAVVGSSCSRPGPDSDRDGLADAVEVRLSEIGAIVDDVVVVRQVVDQTDADGAPVLDDEGNRIAEVRFIQDPALPGLYGLVLDADNAFSTTDLTGEPIADLDRADTFLRELDTAHLTLGVITERQDRFLAGVQSGLDFLENSLAERKWEIDTAAVAAATGLSDTDAERSVGLYNGFCARCHTAGYQAGVAYEELPGSGAWGPALRDGRSVVQFPSAEDHVRFIVNGSVANQNYGVNGLGRGWMPGFGQILGEDDIALIVAYERSL